MSLKQSAMPLAILAIQQCVATAQLPLPTNGIITQPGAYYLPSDLLVSRGTGIDIQANNVTIDLKGHALRFTGAPHAGTFGITAFGRANIQITNGAIGAFWFNIHASQANGLTIDNVKFDDIPYIGINAAQSDNVTIRDNMFSNFRYDISKATDPYVIGINIGAEDSVITRNEFDAQFTGGDPNLVGVETVLVLFSADVSLRSVVTHNVMSANVPLNRSYGLWVASNAHVSAAHNTIRNMRYGITLASDATSLASYNHISVGSPSAGTTPLGSTFGIFAISAEQVFETGNQFVGQTHPTFLPAAAGVNWDNSDVALILDVNDLSKSSRPGIGYDQISFPGTFTHGGSVALDVTQFVEGSDYISDLKLIGWGGEVGSRSKSVISFIGGPPHDFEFRSDGLYLTDVGLNFIPEPTTNSMLITGLLGWGTWCHWPRKRLMRADPR